MRCGAVRYGLVRFGGLVEVRFKYGTGAVRERYGCGTGAVRFVNFLLAPTVAWHFGFW